MQTNTETDRYTDKLSLWCVGQGNKGPSSPSRTHRLNISADHLSRRGGASITGRVSGVVKTRDCSFEYFKRRKDIKHSHPHSVAGEDWRKAPLNHHLNDQKQNTPLHSEPHHHSFPFQDHSCSACASAAVGRMMKRNGGEKSKWVGRKFL